MPSWIWSCRSEENNLEADTEFVCPLTDIMPMDVIIIVSYPSRDDRKPAIRYRVNFFLHALFLGLLIKIITIDHEASKQQAWCSMVLRRPPDFCSPNPPSAPENIWTGGCRNVLLPTRHVTPAHSGRESVVLPASTHEVTNSSFNLQAI